LRKGRAVPELAELLSDRYEIDAVDTLDQALDNLQEQQYCLVIWPSGDLLGLERAAVGQHAAVILETIGQGVGILDFDGRLIWGNEGLIQLPKQLLDRLSKSCNELFAGQISAGKAQQSARRFCLSSGTGQYFEVTASPVVDAHGKFEHIAVAAWDVTASRLLQEKLNAIDKAGREIVHLDSQVVEKMEVGQRLGLLEEKIIRYTREVLGFDKFSIRLLDTKSNRLELVLSAGISEQARNVELFASSQDYGIRGHVAATGKSYICPDIKADRRYMHGIDKAASSLTVPLMLDDQIVGIFNVESETAAAFNEDDRQFAEIFGRYVAVALNILDLLVVERYRASDQLVDNLAADIAGPLNDILTDAGSLLEQYIGQDDMRGRLEGICENVKAIRRNVRQVAKPPPGLLGARPEQVVKNGYLKARTILVVDDEPIIRQTIADVLYKYGATVHSAHEGNQAIAMIQQNSYDLVLSDIKLPYKNGYEVFAAVKDDHPGVPVIFMTAFGYDPQHSIIRARQEGLSGVLYKPFKVDQLLETIRQALVVA